MKKTDTPLTVVVPSPSADQPSWVRVGIVAVIGFAVGVAWPKLAGVRLGPNAPASAEGQASATPAPSGGASASPQGAFGKPASKVEPAPSASLVAATPPSAAPTGSAAAAATTLTVKPGVIVGCKNEAGEKLSGKACGALGLDALFVPRLKRLAACPAAIGAEGKLSPSFHLDFERSKFIIQMGTKNTVDNVDSFSACIGGAFEKVSINAVTHEHPRYSVQYQLIFAKQEEGAKEKDHAKVAVGSKDIPTGSGAAAETGEAKIAWDSSIVRDTPRTGQIVGRLPRGTAVKVLASENNWYKVRGGTTEGWVYRGAIGR
ncbi:MAG: SH3 domain-containing protein [Myxococcales bacterium]|nr:SH3 domain-containing protein [Myxococcales bacterium]